MESKEATIPDVDFTSIRPDILSQVYRFKLEEYGYLKATVTGIPRCNFSWDNLYEEEKTKKHRLYGVDKLVDDVLIVSTMATKTKWTRVKNTVTIEQAIVKLREISKGDQGPYEVVYVILEEPAKAKSLKHFKLEGSFENLKSVMHTAMEKSKWKKGVQTLYVYAGQCMTVFPIHDEDNKFESINVNIFGADKYWDIIPPRHSDKVRRASENLKSDLQKRSSEKLCSDFLQHKRLLLTDAFLEKYGIEIYRVRQPAGTLMIIGPDVYHQGVNLGDNVAIAINFTSIVWHSSVYLERRFLLDSQCNCNGISARFTEKQLETIANLLQLVSTYTTNYNTIVQSNQLSEISTSNNSVVISNQSSSLVVTSLMCLACNVTFAKLSNLNRHNHLFHSTNGVTQTFFCKSCNVSFSTKGNLTKHIRNHKCT